MRVATSADVPHIVALARRFYEANPQAWPYSEADTTETVRAIVEGGFAAVTDGGFILGTIMQNPVSRGWVVAKEFLWWAEDHSGASLLSAFRKWALEQGANEIQLSCLPDADRVRRVYGRRGKASEIVYSEVI